MEYSDTTTRFIQLVRDEVEIERNLSYEYGGIEDFEIIEYKSTAPNLYRKYRNLLFIPISNLLRRGNIRLSDEQRYELYSNLFGRTINSSDSLTISEVCGFSKVINICYFCSMDTVKNSIIEIAGINSNE